MFTKVVHAFHFVDDFRSIHVLGVAVAEVAVVAEPPGPYVPLVVERQSVIGAAGDLQKEARREEKRRRGGEEKRRREEEVRRVRRG